jgi:predicted HAD superfamily Cof-like phosphohydrolase
MQIDSALDDVREFHQKMNAPTARSPRLLPGNATTAGELAARLHTFADETASVAGTSGDILLARAAMAMEELAEWLTAHERSDLIAAADAWADRAYVLLGDAVAAGLPAEKLSAEVHRSNMTKEPDTAGSGKAIKGASYDPPRIADVLKDATA